MNWNWNWNSWDSRLCMCSSSSWNSELSCWTSRWGRWRRRWRWWTWSRRSRTFTLCVGVLLLLLSFSLCILLMLSFAFAFAFTGHFWDFWKSFGKELSKKIPAQNWMKNWKGAIFFSLQFFFHRFSQIPNLSVSEKVIRKVVAPLRSYHFQIYFSVIFWSIKYWALIPNGQKSLLFNLEFPFSSPKLNEKWKFFLKELVKGKAPLFSFLFNFFSQPFFTDFWPIPDRIHLEISKSPNLLVLSVLSISITHLVW